SYVLLLADANNQYGAVADDTLAGTANADRLWGFEGNDRLSGGAGNDTVIGGVGNDTLAGEDGNDLLDGGLGSDSLTGGLGIDTLQGGKGNDTMSGNDGNDVFRWSLGDGGTAGAPARDVISDFSTSGWRWRHSRSQGPARGRTSDYATNLHNYIEIDTTSVAGQTIIRISSTGGFAKRASMTRSEGRPVHHIEQHQPALSAGLNSRTTGQIQAVLRELVSRKQLIIDGVG
ncbi:MAG: hypothetical protein U5L74_09455, partial [Ideonella sp.]|nr:hypothetical protein [Ideonella sp.]